MRRELWSGTLEWDRPVEHRGFAELNLVHPHVLVNVDETGRASSGGSIKTRAVAVRNIQKCLARESRGTLVLA